MPFVKKKNGYSRSVNNIVFKLKDCKDSLFKLAFIVNFILLYNEQYFKDKSLLPDLKLSNNEAIIVNKNAGLRQYIFLRDPV